MTSRCQDNSLLHASLPSKFSSVSSSDVDEKQKQNESKSKSNTQPHRNKSTKWYNPANLLKISPEPVNPWASNPLSSAEQSSREDIRRAAGVRLQDQRRGYLGGLKIVGYYKP